MAASLRAMVVLMSLYVSDVAGSNAPYVVCTAAKRRSLHNSKPVLKPANSTLNVVTMLQHLVQCDGIYFGSCCSEFKAAKQSSEFMTQRRELLIDINLDFSGLTRTINTLVT